MEQMGAQDFCWQTGSPAQTRAWGERLGKYLAPGDVVCLAGDLGAGKTVLAQGIARGLGVGDTVTSPTFTLLEIYQGRLTLYHFDLYRLEREEELEDIGFYSFTDGDGVALIEWPDKFPGILPASYLWLEIAVLAAQERRVRLTPHGARYQKLCEEMRRIC